MGDDKIYNNLQNNMYMIFVVSNQGKLSNQI